MQFGRGNAEVFTLALGAIRMSGQVERTLIFPGMIYRYEARDAGTQFAKKRKSLRPVACMITAGNNR